MVPLAQNHTALLAYLSTLFSGDTNDVYPYGTDPIFLRSSGLYDPDQSGHEGDYYNTTDPLEVPPTTGAPYGFFHRGLQVHNTQHRCLCCTAAMNSAMIESRVTES